MRPKGKHRRWAITADGDLARLPYRLEVSIVENRRINGKVKQEQVAWLGTIDAHLLPGFWDGLDHATIAALRREDWEIETAQRRVAISSRPSARAIALSTGAYCLTGISTRSRWPSNTSTASVGLHRTMTRRSFDCASVSTTSLRSGCTMPGSRCNSQLAVVSSAATPLSTPGSSTRPAIRTCFRA
jgi:hypothetical protein